MKEIEVKARINNPQEILDKLKKLGCDLSEPITQNDSVFVPEGFVYGQGRKKGINFLRIRELKGRIIFTLKQPQLNELDCIEKELDIDKVDTMKDILKLLGYHEGVKVNKVRIKCKYKDYEVCVDEVDGLGSFVEVEKITDEDAEEVQKELFDFLISLGVKKEDRETHGYDVLMHNKLNK